MERAKKAIEMGDLTTAKEVIKLLELDLSEEQSVRTQSTLRKHIYELKRLFSCKLNFELSHIAPIDKEIISINNEFQGTKDYPIFREFNSTSLEGVECKDAVFENCNSIDVRNICCTGTLSIRNISNSYFRSHSSHLRVTGCKDIVLEVFCKTGVFLQNCTSIKIVPIAEDGNNCNDVFVFNSPSNEKTYEIFKSTC